jgi:(4S)-4-hydroxy-5-phosphonooxypentane-2,3-dione isomerase
VSANRRLIIGLLITFLCVLCVFVVNLPPMIAVVVHLHVKSESLDQFIAETKMNARNSRQEPGVVRFDVIQEVDDPSRFALFELYRDEQAIEAHRGTAHYAKWRDAVPAFLVTERTRTIYRTIEPD